MDSATIETLWKKFAEAIPSEKQILTSKQIPGMPATRYMVMENGQWISRVLLLPPQHDAHDIRTLIAIGHSRSSETEGEIWCDDFQIRFTFNVIELPDNYAVYKLEQASQFELLRKWDASGSGVALTQQELVFILRTTLYGCYNSHPALLGIIRKIDTRKVQEATGVVERSKASISKSLMAEVSGMDALPEIVTFEIPVHQERGFRVNVRVAFEFDPQLEKFRLVVLPGELTTALIDTRQNIAGEIAYVQKELGTSFPVFYGTP